MADFVSLACISCGGKLEITNDTERFTCSYCGIEQIVKRSGGNISAAILIEEFMKIKNSLDRAAELELAQKKKEIEEKEIF